MPKFNIRLLNSEDIAAIHDASLTILRDVGVRVTNAEVRLRMAEAGAATKSGEERVYLGERLIQAALESVGKQYVLHGRDRQRVARYGYGDHNMIASPGQYAWFDHVTGRRREPWLADAIAAATVGDALANVTIACGMSIPTDVPEPIRDVVTTAALVKSTTKPTWYWPVSRESSKYVLEIYKALAGGEEELRRHPMVETFLEPISPLQMANPSLDNVFEYVRLGQPVAVGPMASVSGTGPATLAGTLAQENAEVLAGIVAVQAIAPGTPMTYGGIPHVLDPRTAAFVFSSPEQALMAVAMVEMAKHYGLPVYVNVNLSDSKCLDTQAGIEKLGTLVPAMIAGADLLGHAGILGQDHGGSLPYLVVDNEAMSFAKRIVKGFQVDEDTLALSAIADVGPGGNFLTHAHTLAHLRKEVWLPGNLWTRQTYDDWFAGGQKTMADRAVATVDRILETHHPDPIDPALAREIDHIVDVAGRHLSGK